MTQNGDYVYEADGKQKYRCGFKIGGGIDQDPFKSPQGYPDKVSFTAYQAHLKENHNSWIWLALYIIKYCSITTGVQYYFTYSILKFLFQGVYITFVAENSPASHAGLQMHDKILQV